MFPGHSSVAQQNRIGDMQEKLKMLEERTKEAEKSAASAEADAREKDKELVEALKRMRDYELVNNLLEWTGYLIIFLGDHFVLPFFIDCVLIRN